MKDNVRKSTLTQTVYAVQNTSVTRRREVHDGRPESEVFTLHINGEALSDDDGNHVKFSRANLLRLVEAVQAAMAD